MCDACFRHVDRRANVPSYKKRLSAPGNLENMSASTSAITGKSIHDQPAPGEDDANDDVTESTINTNNSKNSNSANNPRKCVVTDCVNPAVHSLRRKCIRKTIKKFLLNFEMPTGSLCVWLCQAHYDTIIQYSGCVLCKRRLAKNQIYRMPSVSDYTLKESLCESEM